MWDENDDDGLPDAAFTEAELAAGVQHIMRTGDLNATSSDRRVSRGRSGYADIADTWDVQPLPSADSSVSLRFETFAQAQAWAQANPGRAFKRAADGQGFEVKSMPARYTSTDPFGIPTYLERLVEIRQMVPHLSDVLNKSASNHRAVRMEPFYQQTWETELNQLTTAQLERLRLLISAEIDEDAAKLSQLTEAVKHNRNMKAGQYGEGLIWRLQEVREGALADIDRLLTGTSE